MFISKKLDGSFLCSDFVNGIRIKMRYYGYTRQQSKERFKKYLKSQKVKQYVNQI